MTAGRRKERSVRRAGAHSTPMAVAVGLLAATASAGEPRESTEGPSADQAALTARFGPGHPGPELVVRWNELAYQVGFGEDQFTTFKAHRAFSMMHLAIHDALNSVLPLYQRHGRAPGRHEGAHPLAAAAQAAYEVVRSQYPADEPRFAGELSFWLAQVPDAHSRRLGIALGKDSAADVLGSREGDGWDTPGSYSFQTGPGRYQTTPPWNGFVAQPGFRSARPFALASPDQFRPPPPPPLTGALYAAAFEEVKTHGASDSKVRTADQSGYAVWWMEFAEGSVNRLARHLVVERQVNLWTAARLFAHLNLALFDLYIATWDSKYQ